MEVGAPLALTTAPSGDGDESVTEDQVLDLCLRPGCVRDPLRGCAWGAGRLEGGFKSGCTSGCWRFASGLSSDYWWFESEPRSGYRRLESRLSSCCWRLQSGWIALGGGQKPLGRD